jgi:hypothetical protein
MRSFILAAAASLAVSTSTLAQESIQNFSSLTSYALSFPTGDTRGFITTPSWLGLSWEGLWAVGRSAAAGMAFSVHDFNHDSFGTDNFEWGASTGQHQRTLLVTTAMATGRYYPKAPLTLRPYVGLGAGVVYSEESYRLGISQVDRSAVHIALAPEAGWQFPLVSSVDGVVSLRYTIPAVTGDYVGGARSYPFATLSFGIVER